MRRLRAEIGGRGALSRDILARLRRERGRWVEVPVLAAALGRRRGRIDEALRVLSGQRAILWIAASEVGGLAALPEPGHAPRPPARFEQLAALWAVTPSLRVSQMAQVLGVPAAQTTDLAEMAMRLGWLSVGLPVAPGNFGPEQPRGATDGLRWPEVLTFLTPEESSAFAAICRAAETAPVDGISRAALVRIAPRVRFDEALPRLIRRGLIFRQGWAGNEPLYHLTDPRGCP